MQVSGDRARLSRPGQPYHFVYGQRTNLALLVDSENRQYVEVDQICLLEYVGFVSVASRHIQQLQRHLGTLSADQQQIPGNASPDPVDFERIKVMRRDPGEIAGFKCQWYEFLRVESLLVRSVWQSLQTG